MNRPRVSLGLEASRPTLNGTVCAELGCQLAALREAKGLTIQQAAARLLLTPRQVQALEAVNADAFYGADFYAIALRKYAALLGLDAGLVNQALVRPGIPDLPVAASSVPVEPVARSTRRPSALVAWIAIASAVVVTSGVGAVLFWSRRAKPTGGASIDLMQPTAPAPAPPPAVDVPEPVRPIDTPAPASAVDVSPQPAPSDMAHEVSMAETRTPVTQLASLPIAGDGVGLVRVARRTWIFVRYGDNSTVERGLAPGEAFVLQGVPTYLAVGSAEDTAVVIAGRTIDNSLYTTNGQLRVGSSQLARLSTQQQ